MKDTDWNDGIMEYCVKIDQILFGNVLFLSHIPEFQFSIIPNQGSLPVGARTGKILLSGQA
jgi:hypothetical protein